MATENSPPELELTETEALWNAIQCVKEAVAWMVTDLGEKVCEFPHLANIEYFLRETDNLLEGRI